MVAILSFPIESSNPLQIRDYRERRGECVLLSCKQNGLGKACNVECCEDISDLIWEKKFEWESRRNVGWEKVCTLHGWKTNGGIDIQRRSRGGNEVSE